MSVETAIYTRLTTDGTIAGLIGTHELTTADPVRLATTAADLPNGVDTTTTYYARAIATTTFSLHPTASDATGNLNKFNVTDEGTGTHMVRHGNGFRKSFTTTVNPGPDVWTCTTYRLYPGEIPQAIDLEAITYQRISGPRLDNLSTAPGLAYPRFQINSWATTYALAKALAKAVRQRLNSYTGVIGAYTIRDCRLLDEADAIDLTAGTDQRRRYGIRQDFEIWHSET